MIELIQALKVIAWFSLVSGFIVGIVVGTQDDPLTELLRYYEDSFRWSAALTWIISGFISSMIFFALAAILEGQAEIKSMLYHTSAEQIDQTPKLGNSKADINKLKGFKL